MLPSHMKIALKYMIGSTHGKCLGSSGVKQAASRPDRLGRQWESQRDTTRHSQAGAYNKGGESQGTRKVSPDLPDAGNRAAQAHRLRMMMLLFPCRRHLWSRHRKQRHSFTQMLPCPLPSIPSYLPSSAAPSAPLLTCNSVLLIQFYSLLIISCSMT